MIPDFDLSGVLPPYTEGEPDGSGILSPYEASIIEFIDRFATTGNRRTILLGLLKYRAALHGLGITSGFQWLCGSFTENIEQIEGRPPRDLDIVTFVQRPAIAQADSEWLNLIKANVHLFDAHSLRSAFGCHAFQVDLTFPLEYTIPQITYWFGLFSHRRVTHQWKGLVRVPLYDGQDVVALDHLNRADNR